MFEPGLPVFIGERDAVANFLNVRLWMKIVGIGEGPSQLFGQHAADGRLTGSDDSHHNHDHGGGLRFHLKPSSGLRARGRDASATAAGTAALPLFSTLSL